MILFGLFLVANRKQLDPALETFGAIGMVHFLSFLFTFWEKELKDFQISKETEYFVSVLVTFVLTWNVDNLFHGLITAAYMYLPASKYSPLSSRF